MTMNCRQAIALASVLVAASPASRADGVTDWNRIALDTVTASSRSSEQALAALATVHAAMFEALNFVDPRYAPRYPVAMVRQPGTPKDAVAAGAAHQVLRELYPARSAVLDRALKRSLSAIADQQAAYSAAITGRSIGQIVWALRRPEGGRAYDESALRRVNGQQLQWDVDVRGLNSAVAGAIESRNLDAIDGARLRALAWEAAENAIGIPPRGPGSVSFRATAAVQAVLDAESAAHVSRDSPRVAASAARADKQNPVPAGRSEF